MAYDITTGRTVIYSDATEVTASNIADVMEEALQIHQKNRSEIQHLYDVYRGKHDILERIKTVRPEINNRIPVNFPYRIVKFKTGYELGDPIQYSSVDGIDKTPQVLQLNDYMERAGKQTVDISLVMWTYIAGVGYRILLQETDPRSELPFYLDALDPRFTFVVYTKEIRPRQLLCCTFKENAEGKATYYVYTDTEYFVLDNELAVISRETYFGPFQPIFEYSFDHARLGAFEPVMGICNAIDTVLSNRLDGIEQFIQALAVFKGVNINSDDYKALKDEGAIVVPPEGDVKYLIQEMNQTQTQTLVDNMYQVLLEIVGMPNRNAGGRSTSDTGVAVIYRDGWSDAEAYAKNDETMFKASEVRFLRLALFICENTVGLDLAANEVKINFTRRNYENIAQKAEVLLGLLGTDKVHPKLAFQYSGMFPDPESAYKMSEEYLEEEESRAMSELDEETRTHADEEEDTEEVTVVE